MPFCVSCLLRPSCVCVTLMVCRAVLNTTSDMWGDVVFYSFNKGEWDFKQNYTIVGHPQNTSCCGKTYTIQMVWVVQCSVT